MASTGQVIKARTIARSCYDSRAPRPPAFFFSCSGGEALWFGASLFAPKQRFDAIHCHPYTTDRSLGDVWKQRVLGLTNAVIAASTNL
jgi:hypothetical protein